EVAGRVVEEIVFRTRVRGVDPAALGAGVPFIDRRVELQAGVGRGPGGIADAVPQLARSDGFCDRPVGAPRQLPWAVSADPLEEGVRHPHGIVRILASDR